MAEQTVPTNPSPKVYLKMTSLRLFLEILDHGSAGGITEVSIGLGTRYAQVGYFDDLDKAARVIAANDGKQNVYLTLNPVKRELLARINNRLVQARQRTSDADTLCDAWFFIDIDPRRASGISSTDEELKAAIEVGKQVVKYLLSIGVSQQSILSGISGNGTYVLVRLPDYEITNERVELKKRLLNFIADQFSTDRVEIDRTVYNPSRLVCALGTLKMKGDNIAERPHRRSEIRTVGGKPFEPSQAQRCEPFNLYALGDVLLLPTKRTIGAKANGNGQPLDIEQWMAAYEVRIAQTKSWAGSGISGQLYVLRVCPFNPTHKKSAFIIQADNGALAFGCHHNTCAGKDWHALRAMFEPEQVKAHTTNGTNQKKQASVAQQSEEVSHQEQPSAVRVVRLADVQAETVRWLWHPRIPFGKLTLLEGDPGLGKSWLTCALATACAAGRGLPGTEPQAPGNVLLLSAEDGLSDTIRPRLDSMNADVSRIFALDGAVVFDDSGLLQVEAAIIEYQPVLVIIDPLVAYLGAGVDLHRANETRAVMKALARLAERYSAAFLGVRHLTKGGKDRAIYRGIGSIDFTAACRSVLLVGSDPDDHLKRALVHIKCNLAPLGESVGYAIEDGHFYWTGTSTLTAERILTASASSEEGTAQSEAEAFLIEALAAGPRVSKELQKEAREVGIAERTLWRAKTSLQVIAQREGLPGQRGQKWLWVLPEALNGSAESANESARAENTWQTQENYQAKGFNSENLAESAKEFSLGRLDGKLALTGSDDWEEV